MKNFLFTMTGLSPLLHHWDNIEWSSTLKTWREVPEHKPLNVPGDDRSPAFSWLGSLYNNGKVATIPSDNLMRCLMEGGAGVLVPKGKNGKTFKAQTQSGMLVVDEYWPLLQGAPPGGQPVNVEPLLALANELDFDVHVATAKKLNINLWAKRAKIGAAKHVRVRPRFERWGAKGIVQVWDEQLTLAALRDIWRVCGANKGIGDWRPSSPKSPGPFGRFEGTVDEVK